MTQCTATSKRSGHRCQRQAMVGGHLCHMHGGKTPVGFGLPQTKTGRYSKYLPTRLAARYTAALADPDLVGLQDEIALLDSKIADQVAALDRGDTDALWAKARQAFHAMQAAQRAHDVDAIAKALTTLETLLTQGASEAECWERLLTLLDHRRRLVEAEARRQKDAQHHLTSEQAMMLMGAVIAAVKDEVHDPAVCQAIAERLRRLIS